MQANLAAKNGLIAHAEVPSELLMTAESSKKRSRDDNTGHTAPSRESKRAHGAANRNTWHPKLKDMLQDPLKKAGNPSFSKILAYIGKDAEEVYPLIGRKCAPNIFLGKCFGGENCTRDHSLPTDKEVANVLDLTKKLVSNPEGLTQGK
jgi:hypothetical protein